MLHIHNVMMIPLRSRYGCIKDAQQVHEIGLNQLFPVWITAEKISALTCYLGVIVSTCGGYKCTIRTKLLYDDGNAFSEMKMLIYYSPE